MCIRDSYCVASRFNCESECATTCASCARRATCATCAKGSQGCVAALRGLSPTSMLHEPAKLVADQKAPRMTRTSWVAAARRRTGRRRSSGGSFVAAMNTSVPASRTLGTRFVQKPSGLPFGVDKSAWTPVMHKEACADVWTRFFWRDVVCACFVFIACACFVFVDRYAFCNMCCSTRARSRSEVYAS